MLPNEREHVDNRMYVSDLEYKKVKRVRDIAVSSKTIRTVNELGITAAKIVTDELLQLSSCFGEVDNLPWITGRRIVEFYRTGVSSSGSGKAALNLLLSTLPQSTLLCVDTSIWVTNGFELDDSMLANRVWKCKKYFEDNGFVELVPIESSNTEYPEIRTYGYAMYYSRNEAGQQFKQHLMGRRK